MVVVDQVHIRILFLLTAVGVLLLLRKPLRYPDKPGSKGFVLTVLAMSLWLASSGLSYFVPGLQSTLVLYNLLLFAISLCFIGWILVAIEFASQRFPSRGVLAVMGAFAIAHFVLLWTNFFWLHELVYLSTTTVENAVLVPHRGPLFWTWAVVVHVLIAIATGLFLLEWVRSSGLRRRQAGVLATTPIPGVVANVVWFSDALALTFDPTPIGVTVGGVVLSWALYRTAFLEVAPVGRQLVVEEMADAVVTLDDRDRVVDWNRAARELFDVDDPTVGMPAESFFAAVPPDVTSTFASTAPTETQAAFELDGRDRHFSVAISPIAAGQPSTAGRVVVVRDITPMKRREQQLLEQNEHLDQFASIVSHDVQGPLMEIRGSADRAVATGDVAEVEHVLDAADRLDRRVDDLLRLARTGTRIDGVERVRLAEASAAAWRRVWSVEAHLDVDTDHVLLADPDRLQQALENLFRNAVEHGGPTVSVMVGSLADGFYVEDDGPGIPDADLDQLFERGFSSSPEGTGLGLTIVRQIVRAHGWSIRVVEASSGGARFEITGVTVERADDIERADDVERTALTER